MNRNNRGKALLLCMPLLVLLIADQTQGQQRRMPWIFYSDTYSVGVALLEVEKVQAELKLQGEPLKKALELAEKLREDRREVYSSIPPGEWQQRGDEVRKKVKELAKTAALTIAESLDETQTGRWLGIALQVRGPAALPGEYLAERLQLTDEQVKKLDALTQAQRQKMFEMFRQSQDEGLSREEGFKRYTALVDETNKKRLAVLSDEQKATFKEMQGEKFEVPED